MLDLPTMGNSLYSRKTGGLGKDLVDLITFAGCWIGSVCMLRCFTVYILNFWNMREDYTSSAGHVYMLTY
jgi:hypothetical protein